MGAIAFVFYGLFIFVHLGVRFFGLLDSRDVKDEVAGCIFMLSGILMFLAPLVDFITSARLIAFGMIVFSVVLFITGVITLRLRHTDGA